MESTTQAPETTYTNSTGVHYPNPGVNVWGVVGVIVFYVAVLLVGLYASWRKKAYNKEDSEDIMLAGRDLGLVMGIFTMTATWVGGGFINGTAEFVYTPHRGLVWCLAPIGYSLSLFMGGLFFAGEMRRRGYVTMLDPFVERYGQVMGGLLFIPPLMGETFWCGAILSALGASLGVILGINEIPSILISAAIAVAYTVIGGLYSVIFTDVIQLICIFIGLWLCAAFAMVNPAVTSISETATGEDGWLGAFPRGREAGYYVDKLLLCICGGIPWQAYFQRVLASRTPRTAQILSFSASLGCLIMTAPAVIIGAVARNTDWNQTDYSRYFPLPIEEGKYKMILPLVLQYVTPLPVSVIGLGAVSAAVMSSADSSLMSASSMFAHNIYTPIRDALSSRKASQKEIVWVMRISIVFIGCLATLVAITIKSIYYLFVLCSDLVYVVAFPQLVCVIYLPFANTYGSVAGYVIAFILRLTGGEHLINLPALIRYPLYDEEHDLQNFPFKTMSMLISLLTIITVSYVFHVLHRRDVFTDKHDVFHAFTTRPDNKKDIDFMPLSPINKKDIDFMPLSPINGPTGEKCRMNGPTVTGEKCSVNS